MKKRIAVFANGWHNDFIKFALEGIKKKAAEDGVDVFVFVTYVHVFDDSEQNKCQLNIFHMMDPKWFDGAILLSNSFTIKDESERIMTVWGRAEMPLISVEAKFEGYPFVGTDNESGMEELVEHLASEHGVRRVVYAEGIADNPENIIRRNIVEKVMYKYGQRIVDYLEGDFGHITAARNVEKWIKGGHELPDAFICANDLTAIGISDKLFDMGYRVPEDVIVTGFDQIPISKSSFPMMATVSRRWEDIGEIAYEKLFEHIADPSKNVDYLLPSKFVPSESCGCPLTQEDIDDRIRQIRLNAQRGTQYLAMDMHFTNIRIAMSTIEDEYDIPIKLKEILDGESFPADNFAVCVEQSFFQKEDPIYPSRIRGYSKIMNVLLDMQDGKLQPSHIHRTDVVVPNYVQEEGKSNLYIFAPLNYAKYIIGYVVIKNDTKFLYNQDLRRWSLNMDTCFMEARQYVFARAANRKLKEIYMTDFLTNMYNRLGCDEILFKFVEERSKEGLPSILLFVDINRMKDINDQFGHLNGDLAIQATADAMKNCLGDGWLIGRYGGDEFVAVGDCGIEVDMEDYRLALSKDMQKHFSKLNIAFKLTVSVGYAMVNPGTDKTIEDYIKIADDSMYAQKVIAHKEDGIRN